MRAGLAKVAQAALVVAAVLMFYGAQHSASAQSQLKVGVDEARVVPLVKSPATVIVGNPLIADVSVQNGTLLVVMGKNYGTTNIIALDGAGEEIANVSLNVTTSGNFEVSLHRGSSRTTLNCAPMCEEEMNVGDSVEQFEKIFKQTPGRTGLSNDASQPAPDSE